MNLVDLDSHFLQLSFVDTYMTSNDSIANQCGLDSHLRRDQTLQDRASMSANALLVAAQILSIVMSSSRALNAS